MMIRGRRVPDDVISDLAIIDHVGALFHFHRRNRGHRFNAIDIDFRQLLHEGQHRIQLALQMRNLALSDRDPRELGDTAYGGSIDGHYIWPLTANFSPPYSRRGFCAATASGRISPPVWPFERGP